MFKLEKAIAAKKKHHRHFALVSNREKDPFECLRKYRRRENIEFFFEAGKQKKDGARTRVWSSGCLMGRMFVQFLALCYYEYLNEQLRQLKQSLVSDYLFSLYKCPVSWSKITECYFLIIAQLQTRKKDLILKKINNLSNKSSVILLLDGI